MSGPRPALTWAAIVGGSLLAAAVVAPAAYAILLELAPGARLPFSRWFNRAAMLAATVAILLLRRRIGWQGLVQTWRGERGSIRLLRGGGGFVAALLGMAAGVGWALAYGRLGPAEGDFTLLAPRTATTLVGAVLAALLEESFFRGLMLPTLASRHGFPAALIASSGIYSLVHLLVSDRTFVWAGYTPGAGFEYLGGAISRQLEPASLAPLFGLFLAGLVLGGLVERTASLSLAVGLHAGWAAAFPLLRHATRALEPIPGASFLATHHFLIGRPWAWAAIGLSGLLAYMGAVRLDQASSARSTAETA